MYGFSLDKQLIYQDEKNFLNSLHLSYHAIVSDPEDNYWQESQGCLDLHNGTFSNDSLVNYCFLVPVVSELVVGLHNIFNVLVDMRSFGDETILLSLCLLSIKLQGWLDSVAEMMQWVGVTKVGQTVPSFNLFHPFSPLGPALACVVLCTPCSSSSSFMTLP